MLLSHTASARMWCISPTGLRNVLNHCSPFICRLGPCGMVSWHTYMHADVWFHCGGMHALHWHLLLECRRRVGHLLHAHLPGPMLPEHIESMSAPAEHQ